MTTTIALQYIEIDIEYCTKVFGITCTAVLGLPTDSPPGDSPIKCYNTLKTCPARVRPEFTPNTFFTYRFAVPTNYLPNTIPAIPNIKSISFSPGQIALGQNIGSRSALTITFEDHLHRDDATFDKYIVSRPFETFNNGTFWARFRARVPYLRGRRLRWINGTLGQTLAAMETRAYIIDSFSGPNNNGEYVLIAKDILKLADDDRALAPVPSLGFLAADITDVATTMSLSPAGIMGGSTYLPRYFCIVSIGGSEIAALSNQQGYAAGGQPNAVMFDGTNDWLTRGGGLTGAADSKQITISFWIKLLAPTLGQRIWVNSSTLAGATQLTRFALSTIDGQINFQGLNAAGTTILTVNSGYVPNVGIWTHVLFSCDLAGALASKVHLYVLDGGNYATPAVLVDDLMDFTTADNAVGAVPDGSGAKLNANIAELWIAPGAYLDLSVVTNRRKFITADARPVDLGASGTNNGLPAPLIYFRTASPSWQTQVGTGGGYTLHGSLPVAVFNDGDGVNLFRALLNTPASAHKAQDRVQVVQSYQSMDPAVILYDLFTRFAGVPAANINLFNWQAETAAYLNRLFSAYIAQPTGVNTLVSELCEQAGLSVWWDDEAQLIGLQVLRGGVAGAAGLTPDNVVADSLQISEQPDQRVSSVHTYFGQITPLMSLTDPQSFRSLAVLTNAQSESDYGSPAIKEIFARWIPALGRTIADRINSIILARFVDPPRHFKLQVMRDIPVNMNLAAVYNLTGWPLQDSQGTAVSAPIQVTRLKPGADVIELEADEMLFTAPVESLAVRSIIIDANTLNFNAKSAHDSLYPAASSGDSVSITINAGVIVGSIINTSPAFDVGTWPAGVSISLTINGRIEGKGGDGGATGHSGPAYAASMAGGPAFFTRKLITIFNSAGQIWGGGGGGGGAPLGGGDGGGGAGSTPGGLLGLGTSGFGGTAGTTELGGHGGYGTGVHGQTGTGGDGGNPAVAGENSPIQGGFTATGGAAGVAIDGISFVTLSGTGSILGTQIN